MYEAGTRLITLFFMGRKHVGENLAEVLNPREPKLTPPLHMCDGLPCSTPALTPFRGVIGQQKWRAGAIAHARGQDWVKPEKRCWHSTNHE